MKNIDTWNKNVSNYINELNQKLLENEEDVQLYNGFYVWDSKILQNPKIMFIGINPGNGNPENDVKKVITKPCQQMSYLEYLDGENESYTLAKETVEVFYKNGYNKEEVRNLLNEKTVKTNFFYIITSNQTLIKEAVSKVTDFKSFQLQSYIFTADLIDILKPDLVIFEGKSVFDMFKDYDDCTTCEWFENFGSMQRLDGTKIIGYSRNLNKYNNIKDLDGFAKYLSQFL